MWGCETGHQETDSIILPVIKNTSMREGIKFRAVMEICLECICVLTTNNKHSRDVPRMANKLYSAIRTSVRNSCKFISTWELAAICIIFNSDLHLHE